MRAEAIAKIAVGRPRESLVRQAPGRSAPSFASIFGLVSGIANEHQQYRGNSDRGEKEKCQAQPKMIRQPPGGRGAQSGADADGESDETER